MTTVSVSQMATFSPERKTDKVRRLIREGDLKGALRIAKCFRLGVTPEQRHTMAMAYECLVHPEFYVQLGHNPEKWVAKGREILLQRF